eukprot:5527021-Pleurochrysis_carterae.AAC.1
MRPTSLRALASIAAGTGMHMRRWDFVAAYLASCRTARWCIVTPRQGARPTAPMAALASVAWRNPCTAWRRQVA